jgi:hypothetical protein
MSAYHSLPFELRENVYKHVLIAPLAVAIPPDVDATDELLIDREDYSSSSQERHVQYIKYLIKPPPSACVALLLLNHQTHEEVKSVLRRMEGEIDYDIDIVVADQAVLFPTWTRLPVLSRRIRSVKATFRIAGDFHLNENRYRGNPYRGFRAGDGAPPAIVWAFYNILHRFLVCGPVGRDNSNGKDRKIILDQLEMEVLTPPHIEVERFKGPNSCRHYNRSGLGSEMLVANDILAPDYLANFIRREIRFLLGMGYHALGYGDILYERIGSVRILQDGVEKGLWELGDLLPTLKFNEPGSSREPIFAQWRAKIPEVRMKNGLSVPSDLVVESLSTSHR